MDRRDFLLLKTRGRLRIAELSCEVIYMRSVDARVPVAAGEDDFDPLDGGEPAPTVEPLTLTRLLESLEATLTHVDVVRVTDGEWLEALDDEWRRGLEARLASVRARGGKVELAGAASSDGTVQSGAA